MIPCSYNIFHHIDDTTWKRYLCNRQTMKLQHNLYRFTPNHHETRSICHEIMEPSNFQDNKVVRSLRFNLKNWRNVGAISKKWKCMEEIGKIKIISAKLLKKKKKDKYKGFFKKRNINWGLIRKKIQYIMFFCNYPY